MKVIVGAPVFNRAWILPTWWKYMAKQTVQPDGFCFVMGESTDNTQSQLFAIDVDVPGKITVVKSRFPVYTRDQRGADSNDKWRARHMAAVRNELRTLFLKQDADVFISLDTDILLTDPTSIEQMVNSIENSGHDVVCALTSLSPNPAVLCCNAGWWAGGDLGDYHRGWRRAEERDVEERSSPVRIDIPMAVYAIRRWMLAMSKYKEHECGEDIGFADSLQSHLADIVWLTHVKTQHVWGPTHLR
jgi:hypothetical protein